MLFCKKTLNLNRFLDETRILLSQTHIKHFHYTSRTNTLLFTEKPVAKNHIQTLSRPTPGPEPPNLRL